MGPPLRERVIALFGLLVCIMMILMKVVPGVPGHFSGYEWLSLVIWVAVGALLGWQGRARPLAA
jgi:small basic protein